MFNVDNTCSYTLGIIVYTGDDNKEQNLEST